MYVIKRKRICLILIALLLGIFVYSYEETKINLDEKTQSTTATLAILCGALCWGIEKILKRHMKKTMIAVMCFVICYIPVSMGLQWGITNISEAIGTQIVYPVDYEYASVRDLDDLTGTIHVYAAEREDMSQLHRESDKSY